MYAELNTKSDFCAECGSTDELQIVELGDGELGYKCVHCGCTDPNKLHAVRRVCGYLSSYQSNSGRLDEIRNRFIRLDNRED